MRGLDFELKDEHEHEFIRKGNFVAFADEIDLNERLQIGTKKLKVSKIGEVKFRELSVKQYLCVYKFMLRDNYRQEKRGTADIKKIALIQKYIERQDNQNRSHAFLPDE